MTQSSSRSSLFAILEAPLTTRLLRGLIFFLAIFLVCMFVGTALRRLHYPFDNEWLEDGNLIEVARVAHHLPLYTAPTAEYTPFIYAPLYFWVAAQVSHVVGLGFAALRMVSIVSTLGVFGCIFVLVYGEAPRGSRVRALSAALGVGLFASVYVVGGLIFDLGRVDMLCLLFSGLALIAGRRGYALSAAVLWALAFQTKQGILPIAVLALCTEWQRPRRLLLGLGSFLVLAAGSVVWLNRVSGGWYSTYVFKVAGGFRILPHEVGAFLPVGLVQPMGLAILIIFAAVLTRRPHWRKECVHFWSITGLGMVGFTFYVRVHEGASANANLPAYLWIAIVAGICFERLYRWAVGFEQGSDRARSAPALLVLLLLAGAFQLLAHVYWMGDQQVSPNERTGRAAFIEQMRRIPGDVLIFEHPQYAALAGKKLFADGEAVEALISNRKLPYQQGLLDEYARMIDQHQVSAVVLDLDTDQSKPDYLPADFEQQYPVHVYASGEPNKAFTSQPEWIRMPCASATTPDPRALFPDVPVEDSACAKAAVALR